jgi:U3 small nucleolar ribonucleoprotein component
MEGLSMSKYVFLYKDNSEDRDCVAYVENKPMRFECDHYFGGITLSGACWSGRRWEEINYSDIKTVLTEQEFEVLKQFDKNIHDLGYGIKKGDDRYNNGVELCNSIQYIFDKLNSEENQALFKEVIQEETEYLMNEYNLDESDIEQIFNEYSLDYRDRGIVGYVFKDSDELGYEEAWQLGYIKDDDSISSKYFDTSKFGQDLLEDENYLELSDGRVVSLMY